MQNNVNVLFKQGMLVLVALVSVLVLAIGNGAFSVWSAIAGLTLFLILRAYGRIEITSRLECLAYSAAWSLSTMLIVGFVVILFMQTVGALLFGLGGLNAYRLMLYGIRLSLFDYRTISFLYWLVAFIVVYNKEQSKLPVHIETEHIAVDGE